MAMTVKIVFDTYDFNRGPWVAGVVVLSVVFVVLFAAFALGLVLLERYAREVDGGKLVKSTGPGSVQRQRTGSDEGGEGDDSFAELHSANGADEEDGTEDADDEEEE
jgi:hypothetical protein